MLCSMVAAFIFSSCTQEEWAAFTGGAEWAENALSGGWVKDHISSGDNQGGGGSSTCSTCGGSGRVGIGYQPGVGQVDGTCNSCGGTGRN